MVLKTWKQKRMLVKANNLYGEYYQSNNDLINGLLAFIKKQYSQIAVWGAGLKGQAFLAQCDTSNKYVDIVIDMDEKKQNKTLITGHVVCGFDKLEFDKTVILVVNANFYTSICFDLVNNGYDIKKMRIVCLDHFIQGKYSLTQIQDDTMWERKRYYD